MMGTPALSTYTTAPNGPSGPYPAANAAAANSAVTAAAAEAADPGQSTTFAHLLAGAAEPAEEPATPDPNGEVGASGAGSPIRRGPRVPRVLAVAQPQQDIVAAQQPAPQQLALQQQVAAPPDPRVLATSAPTLASAPTAPSPSAPPCGPTSVATTVATPGPTPGSAADPTPVVTIGPAPARGPMPLPVSFPVSLPMPVPAAPGPISAPTSVATSVGALVPSSLPSSAALDQAVAAVQFGAFLPPVSASPPNEGQPFEAAPSGPTVPTPIHQQVAAPLLQLRARGDGVHRLLLELHPADLGQVNVEVRLHSGEMKISLTSGSDAAREAIRAALPQLRTDLASVGLAATDISVNLGSSDASAGQGRQPDGRQAAVGQHNPGRAPEDRTGGADRVTAPSTHPRYAGPTTGIDRWL